MFGIYEVNVQENKCSYIIRGTQRKKVINVLMMFSNEMQVAQHSLIKMRGNIISLPVSLSGLCVTLNKLWTKQ